MKLSYIIPLYNAEAYIGKCLDSILDSDIDRKEYEIIVIDDGSKDNGQAVVRQYAQKYDNIKLLVQENQGQSVARNYGIREAQGKYIWFVDSDDYIDAKTISSVLDEMDENELEVCKFDMIVFKDDGTTWKTHKEDLPYGKIYSGEELIVNNAIMGSVCDGLFLRSFLVKNQLSFYPGIIHQDSEFTIRSTALAKKIEYVDKHLYVYRYNENSSTRSKTYEKKLKSHISDAIISRNVYQFVNQNEHLSQQIKDILSKQATSIVKGRLLSYLTTKDKDAYNLFVAFTNKAISLGIYPIRPEKKTLKDYLLYLFLNNKKIMSIVIKLINY